MQEPSHPLPGTSPYDLFILGISVYVLVALAVQLSVPLSPHANHILQTADTAICLIFLFDFLHSLLRSKSKLEYFVTWGWIDLISSIPMLGPLRVGRAVRLVRILQVMRGFKSVRNLAAYMLARRSEAAFAAVAFVSILLVIFSSISILEFERGAPGANIHNAEDALWWSYVTITTVGYGDFYPVTTEGRMVAAVLMTAGVGLFGTFTGFVASWFLAPGRNLITIEESKN